MSNINQALSSTNTINNERLSSPFLQTAHDNLSDLTNTPRLYTAPTEQTTGFTQADNAQFLYNGERYTLNELTLIFQLTNKGA